MNRHWKLKGDLRGRDPGRLVSILVAEGDAVREGQDVAVFEEA